jgi:hypothetical protein
VLSHHKPAFHCKQQQQPTWLATDSANHPRPARQYPRLCALPALELSSALTLNSNLGMKDVTSLRGVLSSA